MVRRNIEQFEIVFIVFDLGSFDHLVTHADKDTLHFLLGDLVGMTMSYGIFLRGKRYIDLLRRELALKCFLLQFFLRLLDLLLDRRTGIIDHLAKGGTLLRADVLHAL